jgi:serine/threonine protein kinase
MEPHRLALPAGYRLENYEIQGVLGKGGFGITYVAYDWTLGRHMAIKELLPDTIVTRLEGSTVVAMSPAHEEGWQWARERFVDEARILAGFRHPNIIAVHRLIEANGTVYLVMDHLSGGSYEARLREIGKEPDQESLMRVIGPILEGLKEVHAAGLLHRDIKPDNILFDWTGNPILIDFGSARASVGATMTMTSIVTHGYSPIEQYQTKGKMGPWTDIYAMAAVMCRAITGEKPPVASDRLMEDDFVSLLDGGYLGYQATLLEAVDRGLLVRPEERPQSVQEWEDQLHPRPKATPDSSIWKEEFHIPEEAESLVGQQSSKAHANSSSSDAIAKTGFWTEFVPFKKNVTEEGGVWAGVGRIGRRQFFSRFVCLLVLSMIALFCLGMFINSMDLNSESQALNEILKWSWLFVGALWIPSTIKRLHDTGNSGWLSVLLFMPFLGNILILLLCFLPGQKTINKHGVNPHFC